MPKSLADAHLGFEIVRDGKVIGFTWQNVYTDTTANVNGNYTYTINAYDRSLNQYARCSFNTSTFSNNNVARVGYSAYTSLKDAVNAASAGDTIYLMDNIYMNEPVDINKNLTFTTSDSTKSISIYYSSWYKSMFNITNGASVTFAPSGTGTKGIVFRSIDYKLAYSLFKLSGGSTLTFKPGVYFYDVISYDNGAIVNASGSQVVFDGVIAEHCRTNKDGLVYLSGGSVMTAKNGSVFRYNVANGSGSVVCANSYNDRVTDGTVSKKTFTVTVKESQTLKNLSKAGASVVSAGSSVKISFAAENGTEPYYYKVERMLVGESDWVTVKDYTAASYINIKLSSVGTYNIRVTVQDMSGETAVKYITIRSE